VKIEGVLSGTLSYIFNEFSTGREGGPSFSAIVTTAREKGYTVRQKAFSRHPKPTILFKLTNRNHTLLMI
jgi:hypothetical protein